MMMMMMMMFWGDPDRTFFMVAREHQPLCGSSIHQVASRWRFDLFVCSLVTVVFER